MMNVKLLLGGVMITVSTLIFAQEKQENNFQFKGDSGHVNKEKNIITYTGNVSITSEYFTCEYAERAVCDNDKNEITIYKPKNLKLINVDELEKLPGERDFIVFNTKTKKLTL
ncbi:hypothetical protein [Chryseobacterium caseinilyticum]|uniref:Organic solvent tolerance-like N-terminal domain-containing protein n=1 Tax=Chryseobacterium caseinilyticum TaxID=2771428 RepID=A0ABR8Z8H0_9FLAO|nr:hypothetical protein [Chryseobacterium caseinilyticum]MBD8081537.1 hypothetical protein [Chryseobacterium caseinilyticum]